MFFLVNQCTQSYFSYLFVLPGQTQQYQERILSSLLLVMLFCQRLRKGIFQSAAICSSAQGILRYINSKDIPMRR